MRSVWSLFCVSEGTWHVPEMTGHVSEKARACPLSHCVADGHRCAGALEPHAAWMRRTLQHVLRVLQPVPTMSGHVDKAVLERMAKIMSYMRVSTGKPGKKPKKKDKLAALHGMGHSQGTNFPVVHGTENIIPKAAGMHCLLGCACQSQEGQRHMGTVGALISMHVSCSTPGRPSVMFWQPCGAKRGISIRAKC